MAAEQRILTSDDTIRALTEKKDKDGDEFYIKVMRRAHLGSMPELVATLSNAQLLHFTSPEFWLPQLCGGGKYLLTGFHATNPSAQVGGSINFSVQGDPRDVDFGVFKKADWRGPATLEHPKQSDGPSRQQQEGMPLYDVRTPPAPGSGDSATRPTQAWPRQAGGVNRAHYGGEDDWRTGAAALEAERRSIEKERLENEREKHRAELEAGRKQHEADMKALRAELLGEIRQSKPTGPDPANMMFMEMMKQSAEDRRAAALQAAEDRRAAADRDARANERFAALLEKLSERKEKDPLDMVKSVVELVGKKSDGIEGTTKMMHSMMETMGTINNVAMDFVNHAASLQLGGGSDEPAWVKGVDRLMKGIAGFAKAQSMRPPPVPAGGLPFGQPQQQQAQPPAPPAPPQPRPAQNETEASVLEQIELAIRAKISVNEIAKVLIQYFQDPSIQTALAESGGDFEAAVQKRLGKWVTEAPSNAEYMKSLFKEVEAQLVQAGFVAEDSAEPEEEEAQVEEGDEDDDG
jgi:hypothetical protein